MRRRLLRDCGSAQDANLEKLGGFKTTGTPMMEPIPQTGENVEALKAIAAKIKVPAGFKVSLYAVVPDARHMAVGPQGVVTFVGTRKELVYSMTDRNKDRVADDVKVFAPSIKMAVPNGVCFSQGRPPLSRRTEPRAVVPGGRVLL